MENGESIADYDGELFGGVVVVAVGLLLLLVNILGLYLQIIAKRQMNLSQLPWILVNEPLRRMQFLLLLLLLPIPFSI